MIFQITQGEKTYNVDDLKPFDKQTKAFQKAFNKAEKQGDHACLIADFDNAQISVFYSVRVIITIKDSENEDI